MKNYKQILEAINRGIKFALDDFDDNEEIQGQANSKVKYQYGTKEWQDLMNEVIDLGLPSGTLWCKYNLDVNHNQLSKPEDWYGKYYSWAELEGNKSEFSWFIYKYAEHYTDLPETKCLTKYCNDPQRGYNKITYRWGFTDNLTELLPEDDAAYQNKKLYNYRFHIPTKKQFEELIKYTKNYWIKNYNPNKTIHNSKDDGGIQGLNGRVFEGKNGNQMFIPAAGYRIGYDTCDVGFNCYLWSSSLDLVSPTNAYCMYLDSVNNNFYVKYRYLGFTIRPIIKL